MITCMGLLGVLFSFSFVRYLDRRVILLVGVTACGLTQLGNAITWTVAPNSPAAARAVVAFIALFTFFYVAYGKSLGLSGAMLSLTPILSSVCVVTRRRVSQYCSSRLLLRPSHRSQFSWELAWYLHGSVFHQSCGPQLGPQIWVRVPDVALT